MSTTVKNSGRVRFVMALALCAGLGVAHAGGRDMPATPAPVNGLLAARAFTLQEGYRHRFSGDRPYVDSGYLLVLDVDPALVFPRQTAEPVLYVGDLTAERLNAGHRSGRLVVIVPARVDLERTPIWFGTPNLPERVDPETAREERARALASGIRPPGAKAVSAALLRGGGPLAAANLDELLREAGHLIVRFSPEEKALADRWAMPPGTWTERKRPSP